MSSKHGLIQYYSYHETTLIPIDPFITFACVHAKLEVNGEQYCAAELWRTYAAAEEVDLLAVIDPNIKPATVGNQQTCWRTQRRSYTLHFDC